MKFLSLIVCCCFYMTGAAQSVPDFKLIKLEKQADFKAAEPYALLTANYVLGTAVNNKNPDRLEAYRFLLRWMDGIAGYSFKADDNISRIIKSDMDLFGIFMAAMIQERLQHKDTAITNKTLNENALKLLLSYCDNPKNNFRPAKQLKKLAGLPVEPATTTQK